MGSHICVCPFHKFAVVLWMTLQVLVTSHTGMSHTGMTSPRTKFKAAVYEHDVILPDMEDTNTRKKALAAMQMNLDVYSDQARLAADQNASIIVFPEDGLYGFNFTSRAAVLPFLETIPDPAKVTWSACSDPDRFKDTEVQRHLSCLARNNSIYLVANIGDVQPCGGATCPPDGHFQYNTAVAFDPNGTLVARYHKRHLFYEIQFDTPEPEYAYFDTPFGRFGLFICFDVMFREPAVTMVTRYNVTNIAFPTAWMDALPLLSALGFHSSFARGLGVNFLAANLHLPDLRFHGSGIYSPAGSEAFYYNSSVTSPGKLMLAELDVLPGGGDHLPGWLAGPQGESLVADELTERNTTSGDVENPDDFQAELFGDMFTFKLLSNDSGSMSVNHNRIGCHLNYSRNSTDEMFALGAFDGLHTLEGRYYLQICALVRCANTSRASCGSGSRGSRTHFSQLQLRGDLGVTFIYPQLLVAVADDTLALAEPETWTYSHVNSTLTTMTSLDQPVVSAALVGRWYVRDGEESTPGGARRATYTNWAVTACVVALYVLLL